MKSSRGTSLGLLGAVAAALVLAPLAAAGTSDDPEVEDMAADQELAPSGEGTGVAPELFPESDLVALWIDNETADTVQFHLQVGDSPSLGFQVAYVVHMTVAAQDFVAYVNASLGVAPDPANPFPVEVTSEGVAENATFAGNVYTFNVSKDVFSLATPGGAMTNLSAESAGTLVTAPLLVLIDRAPDEGSGRDYNFTVGPPTGDPFDTDGDGLNDTWEEENFGNLDQESADDPDGDGLTNAAEQARGTDPGEADTDGDGVDDGLEVQSGTNPLDPDSDDDGLTEGEEAANGTDPNDADTDDDSYPDGQEVEEGTDPLDPDDHPGGPPVTPSPSPSRGPSPSPIPTDDEADSDSIPDKIRADIDYALIATGGFVGVTLLAIIALAGRWGL